MEDVLITRTPRPGVPALRSGLRRLGRERLGVYRGMFLKRLLQWPFRAASRHLAGLVPRQRGLIAFGSVRNRLADNSAYLFLNLARDEDLRCVWITGSSAVVKDLRKNGYEAHLRWSIHGISAAIRASFYVYSFAPSDINIWFSDRPITVNLWHGVGVKRIERDRGAPWDGMYRASDRSITGRVFADDRRRPDWLVTTSAPMSRYFAQPFDISLQRCLELGYPRNDHLVRQTRPPSILVDATIYDRLKSEALVVGYFPTWRYDSFAALPDGSPDLDEIARVVGDQGGVVLFKPHHQSAIPVGDSQSLVLLSPDSDLNAYLGLCDVLITDYSSVAADFLLLDRPIVAFAPDVEEGVSTDRFSLDPRTMQPGLLVRTAQELSALLGDIGSIPRAENFAALRDHYWGSVSSNSSDAVGEFIKSEALANRAPVTRSR